MPRRSSRTPKARFGKDDEEIDTVDSEDEWVPDDQKRVEDEWVPDDEKRVKEEEGETATETASEPLVPLSKPKRRRKKVFVINEEEEALPTYTRKTDNGGYAHTNLSKSRISKANAGNVPWNFGKRRSSADKAKIAAGVRARNRTILLQKLKRLGMTEEEYMQKKKEIKYLRERIRRAKRANSKHRDKAMEKKLQDAIDATNDKKVNVVVEEEKSEEKDVDEEQKEDVAVKKEEEEDQRATVIFSKEITWRPLTCSGNDSSYDECPNGGPGGLICCESCSTKYNMFLTRTSEDVETHRMIKESGEVTEILSFLQQKKNVLKDAVDAAKTKIPPLPPPGSGRLNLRQDPQNNGNRKPGITNKFEKPEINAGAWDLTSSVDIGFIGGFASV